MAKKVKFKISFNVVADFDQDEYQKILDELKIDSEEYIKKAKLDIEKELKAWIFRNEDLSNVKVRMIKS